MVLVAKLENRQRVGLQLIYFPQPIITNDPDLYHTQPATLVILLLLQLFVASCLAGALGWKHVYYGVQNKFDPF